jgi:hypothetical protein
MSKGYAEGDLSRIRAEQLLDVPAVQAQTWFLSLEQHPERYEFETHGGFCFTEGCFGKVGARFQTREWFFGVPVSLGFELTEVEELGFTFQLVRPQMPIWGRFEIESVDGDRTKLSLVIDGSACLGRWVIQCPGVKQAIRQQIQREVVHIARSMQSAFS